MEERRNDLFTLGIPAAILLAFVIMDALFQAGIFAKADGAPVNYLKPAYSTGKLLNGQIFDEYEKYLQDRFYNLDRWSSIVQTAELLTGKREYNGTYVGKRQTLFAVHSTGEYSGRPVEQSLGFLEKIVTDYHAKVMLIPTSDEIWKNRLPLYADSFDQKGYLDEVQKRIGDEAYVNVYAKLFEKRAEEIYYRTERAWTSLGAYYGYQAWWERSGERLSYYYDPERRKAVLNRFSGSLVKASGREVLPERISVFEETVGKEVSVNYDGKVNLKGYYRQEYLDSDNPMGYFLGDGFGLVKIETGNQQVRSLFVVGDSYANSMIPLIAPHYQTIWLVNPKYYRGNVWSLLENYGSGKNVDVLVLESVTGLLELYQ